MPCAPRQLRLVPKADLHGAYPTAPQSARTQTKSETWLSLRVIEQTRRELSVRDLLPLAKGHCAGGFGMMVRDRGAVFWLGWLIRLRLTPLTTTHRNILLLTRPGGASLRHVGSAVDG